MADIMTTEQRSLLMSKIRGKDTKPEIIVRRYLFSKGLRNRLHVRKLPGSPDIVLPKFKAVIFIDGCFWHGHENCPIYKLPKSNSVYWSSKIGKNKERDARNTLLLGNLGWKVLRVWECELSTIARREETLNNLYNSITSSTEQYMVAEPETSYGNSLGLHN